MLTKGRRLDEKLIARVRQISDRLEFKLIHGNGCWALIPNDKIMPSTVGDFYFIARYLGRLGKENTQ